MKTNIFFTLRIPVYFCPAFMNNMNKYIFIALSSAALAYVACQNDTKAGDKQAGTPASGAALNAIAGNWIAIDFCSFAGKHGSVLKAMNSTHKPYAYAVTLSSHKPDSALCFNGMESYYLPIKIKGDTLVELIGARPGKSIFLEYHPSGNKDMTMYDGTLGPAVTNQMIKARNNDKSGYESFLTALNHHLFPGNFHTKGNRTAVQFTSEGEISGLPEYDRFEVCTAGDCFMAAQEIDVISFKNSKTPETVDYYGYRFSEDLKDLTIFELINAKPDEKGTYQVGKAKYTLTRD